MNQVHGKDFGKNPQRRSAFLGPPALPASPGQSIDICRSEETLSDVVGTRKMPEFGACKHLGQLSFSTVWAVRRKGHLRCSRMAKMTPR